MKMISDKRNFKPKVSRLAPGYFFLVCLLCFSCRNKKHTADEIKIAKTIPAEYLDKKEVNFRADTVYYNQNLYSGYVYSLNESGDTTFTGSYFNGVEEGWHRRWYDDGQLQEERFYINGKKEGAQKGWWPDGKQKFSFTTLNGEYEGEFKEWYSSGLMAKHFYYSKGKEEGSQRLWWDNGTVRANYVIKKGKKYGLIGLKTCINPNDSILEKYRN